MYLSFYIRPIHGSMSSTQLQAAVVRLGTNSALYGQPVAYLRAKGLRAEGTEASLRRSALEVNFNVMRSINSRFTYLLLLAYLPERGHDSGIKGVVCQTAVLSADLCSKN